MSKFYRAEGKVVAISGQTADVPAGRIFRKGGVGAQGNFWTGIVVDDIIGTSSTLTTLDGRPIMIGDGVAAEAQSGDGKGDMGIVGVYTLLVDATSAAIVDADPCYAQVADFADPDATLISSGITENGGFVVSGALVGFAVGPEYTGDTAPYTGRRVVDVKLLGLPLHNIANTGA